MIFYTLNLAFYWFHNFLVYIKLSEQDFMNIDNVKNKINVITIAGFNFYRLNPSN